MQQQPSSPNNTVDDIRRLPFPTSPALDAALVSLGIHSIPSLRDRARTEKTQEESGRSIVKTRFTYIDRPGSSITVSKKRVIAAPREDNTAAAIAAANRSSASASHPAVLHKPNRYVSCVPPPRQHQHHNGSNPLSIDVGLLSLLDETNAMANCSSGGGGGPGADCDDTGDDDVYVGSYFKAEEDGSDPRDRNHFEQLDALGELPRLESTVGAVRVFVPARPSHTSDQNHQQQQHIPDTFEGFDVGVITDNPYSPGALEVQLSVAPPPLATSTAVTTITRLPADTSLFAMCPNTGVLWVNTSRISLLGSSYAFEGVMEETGGNGDDDSEGEDEEGDGGLIGMSSIRNVSTLKPARVSKPLHLKKKANSKRVPHRRPEGGYTIATSDVPDLLDTMGIVGNNNNTHNTNTSDTLSSLVVAAEDTPQRLYKGGALVRVSIPLYYQVIDHSRPILTTTAAEGDASTTTPARNRKGGGIAAVSGGDSQNRRGRQQSFGGSLESGDLLAATTVPPPPQSSFQHPDSGATVADFLSDQHDINGRRSPQQSNKVDSSLRTSSTAAASHHHHGPVAVCNGFVSSRECRVLVELVFEEEIPVDRVVTQQGGDATTAPHSSPPQRSSRAGVAHSYTSPPRTRSPLHPARSTEPAIRASAIKASSAPQHPQRDTTLPTSSTDDVDPRTSFMGKLLPSPLSFQMDQSDARWRTATRSVSQDVMSNLWFCYPLLYVRMMPWMQDVEDALSLPEPSSPSDGSGGGGIVDSVPQCDNIDAVLTKSISLMDAALGKCEEGAPAAHLHNAAAIAADTASLLYHTSKKVGNNTNTTDDPLPPAVDKGAWDISVSIALFTLRADLLQRISPLTGGVDGGIGSSSSDDYSQVTTSALVDLGHLLKVAGDYTGALNAYSSAAIYAKRIPLNAVVSAQLLASILLLQGEAAMMCGLLKMAQRYLERASTFAGVVVDSMEPTSSGGLMARASRAEVTDLLVICKLQAGVALECGIGNVDGGDKVRTRQNQELLSQLSCEGYETHAKVASDSIKRGGATTIDDPRLSELATMEAQGTLHRAISLLLAGYSISAHTTTQNGRKLRANPYHSQILATCAALSEGGSAMGNCGPLIEAQSLVLQGIAFSLQEASVINDTTICPQTKKKSTPNPVATTACGVSGGPLSTSKRVGEGNGEGEGTSDVDDVDVDLSWVGKEYEGVDTKQAINSNPGAFDSHDPLELSQEEETPRDDGGGSPHHSPHHLPRQTAASKADYFSLMKRKCLTEAGEVVAEASSILADSSSFSSQLFLLSTLPLRLLEMYHAAGTTSLLAGEEEVMQNYHSHVREEWWTLHTTCEAIHSPCHPAVVAVTLMAASCEVLASPSVFQTIPLLLPQTQQEEDGPLSTSATLTHHLKKKLLAMSSNSDSCRPAGVPLRVVPSSALDSAASLRRVRTLLTNACASAFERMRADAVAAFIHPLTALLLEWAASELIQVGYVHAAAPLLAAAAFGVQSRVAASREHHPDSSDLIPLCISTFPAGTPASALSPPAKGNTAAAAIDRNERRKHRDALKQRSIVSLSNFPRLLYAGTICGGGVIELLTTNETAVRKCMLPSSSSQQQALLLSSTHDLRRDVLKCLTSLAALSRSHLLRQPMAPPDQLDNYIWPDSDLTFAALASQQLLVNQLAPVAISTAQQQRRAADIAVSLAEEALDRLKGRREMIDHTQLVPLLGPNLLVPKAEMTDLNLSNRSRSIRQHQVRAASSSSPASRSVGTVDSLEALALNTLQSAVLLEACVDCRQAPSYHLDRLVDARDTYKVAVSMLELREELAASSTAATVVSPTPYHHQHYHLTKIALCEALIGVARVEAKMVAQSRLEVVNRDRAAMAKQQASCGKPLSPALTPQDAMSAASSHPLSATSNMALVANALTGTIPLHTLERAGFDMGAAARYIGWASLVLQSTFGYGSQPAGPDRRQHLSVAILEARCSSVQGGVRAWCKANGHTVTVKGIHHEGSGIRHGSLEGLFEAQLL